MPWVPPRTYIAGEMMTAAILNTDHRDNSGEFFRLRQSFAVGGAAGVAAEIVDTGNQSYPGFPLLFRWDGAVLGSAGASVVLRDGTTTVVTVAGASVVALNAGRRTAYLDTVTNGTHRWNLYGTHASGGTLRIFERGID